MRVKFFGFRRAVGNWGSRRRLRLKMALLIEQEEEERGGLLKRICEGERGLWRIKVIEWVIAAGPGGPPNSFISSLSVPSYCYPSVRIRVARIATAIAKTFPPSISMRVWLFAFCQAVNPLKQAIESTRNIIKIRDRCKSNQISLLVICICIVSSRLSFFLLLLSPLPSLILATQHHQKRVQENPLHSSRHFPVLMFSIIWS